MSEVLELLEPTADKIKEQTEARVAGSIIAYEATQVFPRAPCEYRQFKFDVPALNWSGFGQHLQLNKNKALIKGFVRFGEEWQCYLTDRSKEREFVFRHGEYMLRAKGDMEMDCSGIHGRSKKYIVVKPIMHEGSLCYYLYLSGTLTGSLLEKTEFSEYCFRRSLDVDFRTT